VIQTSLNLVGSESYFTIRTFPSCPSVVFRLVPTMMESGKRSEKALHADSSAQSSWLMYYRQGISVKPKQALAWVKRCGIAVESACAPGANRRTKRTKTTDGRRFEVAGTKPPPL
jgi:hypothetical protein